MNQSKLAEARRLYLHVYRGGTLTPRDMQFMYGALEEAYDEIESLNKQLMERTQALEEAVYLLNPTEEDMQKKAGVYRVVTALEKLKEKNT